jgi:polyisoprenoid-binding protein YceI
LGDNRYEADGTLTIKGISRDITLPFTLDIAGDTATMRGEVALQRGDFNVGDSSSTDVGQKVLVRVSLLARALK